MIKVGHQNKRTNMIDGLPSTFNTLFVTRTGKKCGLCTKRIKKEEIENNLLLYTDEFEYVHKKCLAKKEILYKHIREGDLNSPVKLIVEKKKSSKPKSKKDNNVSIFASS